jgi:two-component system, NtrC family, sensor kinase
MDYRLFVTLAPPAVVILVLTAFRTWTLRDRPLARSIFAYLVASSGLLITNTVELLVSSPELTLLFARINYISLFVGVIAWYAFAMAYAGQDRLVRPKVLLSLAAAYGTMLVLIFLNDAHHLFWRSLTFFEMEGFLTVRGTYGPLFWINATMSYAIVLVGSGLILWTVIDRPAWYRHQSVLMILGALLPTAFNVIYLLQVIPGLEKDYTPVANTIAGIAFYFGVREHGLFRRRPLQRRALLEDIPSGVLVVDADGIISDVNPAGRRLVNAPDLRPGRRAEDLPELGCFLQHRDLGTAHSYTLRGGEQSFYVTIRPVFTHRRPAATIITITETTELDRLQEDRDRLQLQLVSQERLATIGQLAAGVAHEVNNPLTAVKSAYRHVAEIAEELTVPGSSERGQIAEMTDVFENAFGRVTGVVRSLLETARPSEGRAMEAFDLHELIETTLQLSRSRYQGVAAIERDYDRLPPIMADPGAINQVLLNIIINAVQALEEPPESAAEGAAGAVQGIIRIETRSEGNRVICRILNNGPPIPRALVDRIFEPFFTTKTAASGSGLGLAISREIIEGRHGGRLTVHDGTLTGFEIALPVS